MKKAILILILFTFNRALASDWSYTNFQVLSGNNYKLGSKERTIFTFEHADSWAYGENYFFFDTTHPDTKDTQIYGEFSPSLSLGKTFNRDLTYGILTDYRITGTIEMGNGYRAYLYGLGIDFKLPSFTYLKLNTYIRDDPSLNGLTTQITLFWLLPIEWGSQHFQFSGFGDFAASEGSSHANQLIMPQFLLDLGNFWKDPEHVFTGIEYSYWNNKLGIHGVHESVIQYMIKWYF